MHGGLAPQVQKAAQRRLAMEQAQRMVDRAGVDMDPMDHLLDSLLAAAKLMEVWGVMVAAIDEAAEEEARLHGTLRGELGYMEDTDPRSHDDLHVMSRDRMLALNAKGEAQIHPYVVEYQRAVERRARLAKLCIDAGIAERQVRVVEEQAALAHRALEATLESLGLDTARRQEARQTYARHLRSTA